MTDRANLGPHVHDQQRANRGDWLHAVRVWGFGHRAIREPVTSSIYRDQHREHCHAQTSRREQIVIPRLITGEKSVYGGFESKSRASGMCVYTL
jgi:endonuclease I